MLLRYARKALVNLSRISYDAASEEDRSCAIVLSVCQLPPSPPFGAGVFSGDISLLGVFLAVTKRGPRILVSFFLDCPPWTSMSSLFLSPFPLLSVWTALVYHSHLSFLFLCWFSAFLAVSLPSFVSCIEFVVSFLLILSLALTLSLCVYVSAVCPVRNTAIAPHLICFWQSRSWT